MWSPTFTFFTKITEHEIWLDTSLTRSRLDFYEGGLRTLKAILCLFSSVRYWKWKVKFTIKGLLSAPGYIDTEKVRKTTVAGYYSAKIFPERYRRHHLDKIFAIGVLSMRRRGFQTHSIPIEAGVKDYNGNKKCMDYFCSFNSFHYINYLSFWKGKQTWSSTGSSREILKMQALYKTLTLKASLT